MLKASLDLFLEEVEDQPKGPGAIPGATTLDGAPSNSIKDWCRRMTGLNDWSPPCPLPLPWLQRQAQHRAQSGGIEQTVSHRYTGQIESVRNGSRAMEDYCCDLIGDSCQPNRFNLPPWTASNWQLPSLVGMGG